MTNIALLPTILNKFLNGQDYTEDLDNLRFLSDNAADKLTIILTNRYINLLQDLTQDHLEQINALKFLFNNFRNNLTENEIIEIYQTGIINSRAQAIAGSPPRSPIRVLQAPGAPTRVRYERGAPNANRRRRLNVEEEELLPIPFILPETFIEDHIKQFELNKSSECNICYEELGTSGVCMNYPCGHVFHCACIRRWNRNTCPMCRQSVTTVLENIELPRNMEFGKRKNKLTKIQSEIKYLNSI